MSAGVVSTTGESSKTGLLNSHPDLRRFSKLCQRGAPPAGCWLLVHEQRRWIRRVLDEFIQEHQSRRPRKKNIDILIAGAASHSHLAGTLAAIDDVLRSYPLHYNFVVVDRCCVPVRLIEGLKKSILDGGRIPRQVRVGDKNFVTHKTTRRLAPVGLGDIVSIQPMTGDLLGLDFIPEDSFDIVMEHFLTTFFSKEEDLIETSRQGYRKVLRSGGWLVSASGFPLGSPMLSKVENIHKSLGFVEVKDFRTPVWDPYGVDLSLISTIAAQNKAVAPIVLDNTLSVFQAIDST